MFERFTEQARQVIVLARDEAGTLNHDRIGTEHILLGLLRVQDGGIAVRALEGLGITDERVRAEVVRTIGFGTGSSGQIPFTPHAKTTLERALREALSLGHNYIGTEHILLGLVRQQDAVATQILLGFDAEVDKIQAAVIALLTASGRHQEAGPTTHAGGPVYVAYAGSPAGSSSSAELADVSGMSDADIDSLIDELLDEAKRISLQGQMVHGKIDILRAERDKRRRGRSQPDA